MTRVTFRDSQLQTRFEEAGYVTFPLIGVTERRALENLVRDVEVGSDPLEVTPTSDPSEHRSRLSSAIQRIFADALKSIFDAHRVVFGALMIKAPEVHASTVRPHADPTTVDEGKFVGCTVWVPLSDASLWGGTLAVLSRSHRLGSTPRGTPSIPTPFDALTPGQLAAHATPVRLGEGEAIAWDQRILHWSLANRSSQRRIAFGLGVIPAEAELRHFFMTDAGIVQEYVVSDDFFANLSVGQPPAGKLLRELDVAPEPIDEETIRQVCGEGHDLRAVLCEPHETSSDEMETLSPQPSGPRRALSQVKRRTPYAIKHRLRQAVKRLST